MQKSVMTVHRAWNNPVITTTINNHGIGLEISVPDFCEAVIQEIGPVTWTFKDATFRKKFMDAVTRVIEGVKEESAKVI